MLYDPTHHHHRRSIRLPGYDYTQPGAYFVTLDTEARVPLFDNRLFREIVETLWRQLPSHFPCLTIDVFVVMPEHLHGILILSDVESEHRPTETPAPVLRTRSRPAGAPPGSVGAIVGTYKSVSARRLNAIRKTPGLPVWQRNYFEHVIRSEEALHHIREYIVNNPAALEIAETW